MNFVNLFANYANVQNSEKLKQKCQQFELEIFRGKETIVGLEGKIGNLNNRVGTLSQDLEIHKEKLNHASTKYYTSVTELESTMFFHKELAKKLEDRTLKEDLALDSLISLISLFLANTTFVDFPLKLFSRIFSSSKKKNYFMLFVYYREKKFFVVSFY